MYAVSCILAGAAPFPSTLDITLGTAFAAFAAFAKPRPRNRAPVSGFGRCACRLPSVGGPRR